MNLTIIIPAKNEGEYLGKSIEALKKALQDWGGEAEIILVDNGSRDNTTMIAVENGCKVLSVKDGTIAKLRNYGALHAKGEILSFLDADCLVPPKWVSYCLEAFRDNKVGLVGTRAIPDLENATWVENAWFKLISGAPRPNNPDWIGTSNLFVKKDLFGNVGGFNEALETAEDVNLGVKVRKSGYCIYLEKRIDSIHLRESKTIKDLWGRELWRGRSNLISLKENGYLSREIGGVLAPIIMLAAGICFVSLGFWIRLIGIICFGILIILPLLFYCKKKAKAKNIKEFAQVWVVAFFYLLARGTAFVLECKNNFVKKMK